MLQCVLSFLLRTARRSAWVTAHVLALWACWIGLSLPAFADCVNGARDPTEQEKQTAVRVLTALREAFPVPPGWKVTNDTKIEAPRFFCKGDEVLRLWFQRAFTREQGMKERTAEYNRRLADAKRLTPEEQGQLADIDKEIGNLAKQMGVPRSGLKQRDLDKDKRAQLESELKQLNDSMTSLRQRRQALATPWQADGPRKKQYEDSIAEATREFRKDTENRREGRHELGIRAGERWRALRGSRCPDRLSQRLSARDAGHVYGRDDYTLFRTESCEARGQSRLTGTAP